MLFYFVNLSNFALKFAGCFVIFYSFYTFCQNIKFESQCIPICWKYETGRHYVVTSETENLKSWHFCNFQLINLNEKSETKIQASLC